jgi:hypothetical protein
MATRQPVEAVRQAYLRELTRGLDDVRIMARRFAFGFPEDPEHGRAMAVAQFAQDYADLLRCALPLVPMGEEAPYPEDGIDPSKPPG